MLTREGSCYLLFLLLSPKLFKLHMWSHLPSQHRSLNTNKTGLTISYSSLVILPLWFLLRLSLWGMLPYLSCTHFLKLISNTPPPQGLLIPLSQKSYFLILYYITDMFCTTFMELPFDFVPPPLPTPLLDCHFFQRLNIMTSVPVLSIKCTIHVCSRNDLWINTNLEKKSSSLFSVLYILLPSLISFVISLIYIFSFMYKNQYQNKPPITILFFKYI